MPTKSEAAEALYRAAQGVAAEIARPISAAQFSLLLAIDGVKTATPDALPAEVQRVVEAADAWEREWGGLAMRSQQPHAVAVAEAVRAYRSSQPEPLSARLARLKPGSVVEVGEPYVWTMIGNDAETRSVWLKRNGATRTVNYQYVTAIISESP